MQCTSDGVLVAYDNQVVPVREKIKRRVFASHVASSCHVSMLPLTTVSVFPCPTPQTYCPVSQSGTDDLHEELLEF